MSHKRVRRSDVFALVLGVMSAALVVAMLSNAAFSVSPGRVRADMQSSLVRSYHSLQAVTMDAELVVLARVVATEQRPFGHFPFTLASVEVTQTIKGAAPTNLRVLQTGGTSIPMKDGSIAEGEATYQGVPVTRPGENYLFFLRTYKGPIASDAFIVLGEFQGKFKVGDDQRIKFTGRSESLTTPEFALPRWADGRTRSEIADLVVSYR